MLMRSIYTRGCCLALAATALFGFAVTASCAGTFKKPEVKLADSEIPQNVDTGLLIEQLNEFESEILYSDALSNPNIPMLSVRVTNTQAQAVSIVSMQLGSGGTGNEANDIAAVKLWLDSNSNGIVDVGTDMLLRTGTYPSDEVSLPVVFSPAPIIPAASHADLLITYTLNPGIEPGKTFEFWLEGANVVEMPLGNPVEVHGDGITSKYLIIGLPPISIGQAKKLPLDPATGASEIVMIERAVVTAYFAPTIPIAYLEEDNRSAGIGALLSPDQQEEAIPIGQRVSLIGRLRLLGGTELVMEPIEGTVDAGSPEPLKPVAMSNKATGGGAFGSQPGVVDKSDSASPVMSGGLNSVGKLIKTCGSATGFTTLTVDGFSIDVVWIDDGSGLRDGLSEFSGIAVMKPFDWPYAEPPIGCVSVTGVLRSIPGADGKPVRLLMPRSYTDAVFTQESTAPN